MAQQYVSVDYYSADYFSVDWWLPSNSADVAGTIATTLENFYVKTTADYWSLDWWGDGWTLEGWGGGTAWYGTFYIPAGNNAVLTATLADHTSSFVGSAIQVDLFDATVSWGVTWVDTEYFAFAGTLTPTLADFTSTLTGTAGSISGVVGVMPMTLADHVSALTGTNTAPANRTGVISTTLADATGSMVGAAGVAGSALGSLVVTLDNMVGTFAGAVVAPTYNYVWASTLDNVAAVFTGASYAAGVKLFKWESALDDFAPHIRGTVSLDASTVVGVRDVGAVNVRAQRIGGTRKGTRVGGSVRKVRA